MQDVWDPSQAHSDHVLHVANHRQEHLGTPLLQPESLLCFPPLIVQEYASREAPARHYKSSPENQGWCCAAR